MYKKFVNALYLINVIAQAIFTLLTPAALMFLISWLFVSRLSAPEWLYAVLIPIGMIAGFISMIRFVISATASLESIEKQRTKGNGRNKNEK